MQWDPANNQFLYAVNPGTRRGETVALGYNFATIFPPVVGFKQLSVTNSVASCTAGRKSASMKASFDNVMVNP